MMKIGIISDTHGFWDDKYEEYLGVCDEIWHAGDIGGNDIAVYGNIDDWDIHGRYSEILRFKVEDVDVLVKHIGGYPGHYDASVRNLIYTSPPQLFISGHSHILKVMTDKSLGLLHINPGAAGVTGWHKERTIVRLTIEGNKFTDCEVITLGKRIKTDNR